jgi:tRNA pseudouridine55 synthase
MSYKNKAPFQQHGVLALDKPSGPTSTGCLEKIKHKLGQKKIGHAGTLDPLAQGILIVLLGQGTKLAPYLTKGEKVYQGTLRIGETTDTYDIKGEVLSRSPWEHISKEQIRSELLAWQEIEEQEIPAYSAAKHKGKPFYALKRQGKEVPEKSKEVRIHEAKILELDLPLIRFRVTCSQGTYIRSLAHSLGKRLGCGAVLTELIREYSQPFGLEGALSLSSVLDDPELFAKKVIPVSQALPHWPHIRLDPEREAKIRNGTWLKISEVPELNEPEPGKTAFLLDPNGSPLALVEARYKADVLYWSILRGLWAGN